MGPQGRGGHGEGGGGRGARVSGEQAAGAPVSALGRWGQGADLGAGGDKPVYGGN